jgi:hemoglobin-like flavoprotein
MPINRHPITTSEEVLPDQLRAIPVDEALIFRLKTVYVLARKGDDQSLAKIFYSKLFAAHPALRSMFPEDLDQQSAKLVALLDQVIDGLEQPEQNLQRLAELGRRHQGYGVQASHYPIVVELLTDAMKEVLGSVVDGATQEKAIEDWRLMLSLISRQMIQHSAADRE